MAAHAVVVERVRRHALVNVVGALDVTRELDVVVGKLANLDIVDTENLLFFGGTKLEDWQELANEIETPENEAGSSKRICATGDRVRELVAELDPVVVEPATGDDGVAIKMGNVVSA